ncbi:MAG: tetratricopeptide repeat protein, partial [Thermodesulfobacteriota bacterium]|nr:tetratricopeptide repeat protein [Thermodesulfobacteriota bacterium]
LGVCYGHQQNSDLALETFDRVLKLDSDNLMAHFNRGFILAGVDRHQEALESLRRAAEIENDNFDVLFQLGKTALELDLTDEALSALEQAAGLEDHRPVVFRYLGQTLLKAGRPENAVDAFKAAARHDPEDAPSLSQLGVLFLDRGTDSEVALSLTRQSVNLDRTNSLFRQRLARALSVAGDLEESEAEYRRAIEMGARSREVFYELGQVVLKQGRAEEAEKLFRESLAVDQEYGPALEALGKEAPDQDPTRI